MDRRQARELAKAGLALWHKYRGQPEYILGRRVHHYTLGAGLEVLGSLAGRPDLVTIGRELKRDDRKDKDEAFLFLTREEEGLRRRQKAEERARRRRIKRLLKSLDNDIKKLQRPFKPTRLPPLKLQDLSRLANNHNL